MTEHMEKSGRMEKTENYNVYRIGKPASTHRKDLIPKTGLSYTRKLSVSLVLFADKLAFSTSKRQLGRCGWAS
jgi:hypothetical protein